MDSKLHNNNQTNPTFSNKIKIYFNSNLRLILNLVNLKIIHSKNHPVLLFLVEELNKIRIFKTTHPRTLTNNYFKNPIKICNKLNKINNLVNFKHLQKILLMISLKTYLV